MFETVQRDLCEIGFLSFVVGVATEATAGVGQAAVQATVCFPLFGHDGAGWPAFVACLYSDKTAPKVKARLRVSKILATLKSFETLTVSSDTHRNLS